MKVIRTQKISNNPIHQTSIPRIVNLSRGNYNKNSKPTNNSLFHSKKDVNTLNLNKNNFRRFANPNNGQKQSENQSSAANFNPNKGENGSKKMNNNAQLGTQMKIKRKKYINLRNLKRTRDLMQ